MTARLASRYAAALQEARKGAEAADKVLAVDINFGDHRDPDQLARELLEKAAALSDAASLYRSAAFFVNDAPEPEGDGW